MPGFVPGQEHLEVDAAPARSVPPSPQAVGPSLLPLVRPTSAADSADGQSAALNQKVEADRAPNVPNSAAARACSVGLQACKMAWSRRSATASISLKKY